MLETLKRWLGFNNDLPVYFDEKFFTPVTDVDAGFKLGLPKPKSEYQFASAVGEIVWVYVAVKAISDAISMLPLKAYTLENTSKGPVKKEITEGFIWDLINYPTPYSGAVEFKQTIAGGYGYAGNSYIYIDIDDGHLVPLHPQDVRIVASKENFIDHYVFRPHGTGKDIILDRQRVIHIKSFNPDNYFYGMSPLQAAWRQINFQDKESDFWSVYWKEGGRVQGILKTDKPIADFDKERIQAQWKKQYGGVRKMQRNIILDNGLEFQQIGLSQKDSQILDKLKMTREDILAVYSVPPGIAGVMELSNYSNMEVQERLFYKRAIKPVIALIEEAFNTNEILSQKGQIKFEFDLSSIDVLKENEKLKAEIGSILIHSSQQTPNEVRADMWKKPALADGNVLRDINGGSSSNNPFTLDAGAIDQKNSKSQIDRLEQKIAKMGETISTLIDAIMPEAMPVPADDTPMTPTQNEPVKPFKKVYSAEDRRGVAKSFDDELQSHDLSLMKIVQDNFARQEKIVLSNLRGELRARGDIKLKGDDVESILKGLKETVAPFAKDLEKAYGPIMKKFGDRAAAYIDSKAKKALSSYRAKADFNFTDPRVAQFIKNRSVGVAGITTQTSLDQLREIIAAKFLENASIPEIADTISSYFDVASASRAATIARTETGAAANEAINDTFEQNRDVVQGREWVTANDDSVRDSHQIDGQQQSMDSNFVLGDGETCAYPQASGLSAGNSINCRCTVVPLLEFES